jgi:tetratricopeptide (TPR) repeat protein
VGTSLNNLAGLYVAQGRYAEAEPLAQRSLGIKEKALGPDHPDLAEPLNRLARTYYFQKRYTEAKPLYERALAIVTKSLPADHPLIAKISDNFAAALTRLDCPDEATQWSAKAKAIWAERKQK